MKKLLSTVYVIIIIGISCNKDQHLVKPDYGTHQSIIGFNDFISGSKIIPSEVLLGTLILDGSTSPRYLFHRWENVKINDTGAVIITMGPGASYIQPKAARYISTPYSVNGWRFDSEVKDVIPASLLSTDNFTKKYKAFLFRNAALKIHIKQVTEYAPSYLRIWAYTYNSTDTTEANKIGRFDILPDHLHQSPDFKIDTTIEVSLPGDLYNSLQWELFGPPDGWGEFYYKYLGKINVKKYESDKRHEILITF